MDQLAEPTGHDARREPGGAAIDISLFDEFMVVDRGEIVALPAGQVTDLVKLLVLSNGRMFAEQIIDQLWPDAAVSVGRPRLRNVLKRLRKVSDRLVARSGDALALTAHVDSDYARAMRAASHALGCTGTLVVASEAVRLNNRPLLPDDLYDEWAEQAREQHRRQLVRLLDRQADLAEQAGDLDIAVMALEAAHEADHAGIERVLHGYKLLKTAGRDSAANALAGRHGVCTS